MTIKEIIIMNLLTTTSSYKDIVAEVMSQKADAKTTDKCVAFYAHQLRKIDKTCLAHRSKSSNASSSMADMIAKYKTA